MFIRQQTEWGCGVSVFSKLTGIPYEGIVTDLPEAANGIDVDAWTAYLNKKGFRVIRHDPRSEYPYPCAHLTAAGGGRHWVYEDQNGILDPAPANEYLHPKHPVLFELYRDKLLTVTVVSIEPTLN